MRASDVIRRAGSHLAVSYLYTTDGRQRSLGPPTTTTDNPLCPAKPLIHYRGVHTAIGSIGLRTQIRRLNISGRTCKSKLRCVRKEQIFSARCKSVSAPKIKGHGGICPLCPNGIPTTIMARYKNSLSAVRDNNLYLSLHLKLQLNFLVYFLFLLFQLHVYFSRWIYTKLRVSRGVRGLRTWGSARSAPFISM